MLLINYINNSGRIDLLIKISTVLNYYINSFESWGKWLNITVFIIINRYFIGLMPWLVIVFRIFFFLKFDRKALILPNLFFSLRFDSDLQFFTK